MSIIIAAKAASSTEGANLDILYEKEMDDLKSDDKKDLTGYTETAEGIRVVMPKNSVVELRLKK